VTEVYKKPRRKKPWALAGVLLFIAGCISKAEGAPHLLLPSITPMPTDPIPVNMARPNKLTAYINSDDVSDVSSVADTLSMLPEKLVLVDPTSRVGNELCRAVYSVEIETQNTIVIYPEVAGIQSDIDSFIEHPERTVHMDVDMGRLEGEDNSVTSEMGTNALGEAAKAVVLLGKTGCDQYMRDIVEVVG
jgi:hypothetical protein